MALSPRPYQVDIMAEIDRMIAKGERPGAVAATGLGKTVTFSAWLAARSAQGGRSLVLVHRDELASQARDTIHRMQPQLRPGIVMANQNDYDRPVVVASVQTLARAPYRRRDSIRDVRRIVADECHRAAAPTWRSTLNHFGAFAGVPTVGFTATMSRDARDKYGLGEVWTDVVKRPDGGAYDTLWGIRNGFLCDVRGIRVQVPDLDLSGVRVRGGDLQQEETAERMLDANTGEAIVKAIAEFAPDGRGVVFAPNVETSLDFAATMNAAGIRTGTILGTTPKPERTRLFSQFRSGELQWLTNAMVLTEGWDAPHCDTLVIARPTKSPGLYQQMIGRGLRLFPGKTECLVLDVCGATAVHGLASLVDLSMDKKIKPKDNQSLLEAEDEYDAIEDDPGLEAWLPAPPPVHSVVGTEVDMFGESHTLWLQTARGTWFIPAGDSLFFLWEQPDGVFTLGLTTKAWTSAQPLWIQNDLDLEIGMALAEQYAGEYAPEITSKTAGWRQQGRATPGQRRDLERYGVPARKTMTSAQAYDEINRAIATFRLDH